MATIPVALTWQLLEGFQPASDAFNDHVLHATDVVERVVGQSNASRRGAPPAS